MGKIDFGTYPAVSAWPEDRFLPEGGGLASILRFMHRSETVGERRRAKRDEHSDSLDDVDVDVEVGATAL